MPDSPPRPNFLIIGAARAATTTLSRMLRSHPQAAIVRGKEPHFFSLDQRYDKGWASYQELYSHCTDEIAIGDASTSYSRVRYHPRMIPRMRTHVPDAKIIYMVRHPLERMVSAYIYRLGTPGTGQVFRSINDAVRAQPMIVDSSRYWEVFDAYRQHFDESRIKIIWFDEFVNQTDIVFREVCQFLGIDEDVSINVGRHQQNSRDESIQRMVELGRGNIPVDTRWDDDTYKWVIEKIRDDNCRFLDYFDKARDYWGDLFIT